MTVDGISSCSVLDSRDTWTEALSHTPTSGAALNLPYGCTTCRTHSYGVDVQKESCPAFGMSFQSSSSLKDLKNTNWTTIKDHCSISNATKYTFYNELECLRNLEKYSKPRTSKFSYLLFYINSEHLFTTILNFLYVNKYI